MKLHAKHAYEAVEAAAVALKAKTVLEEHRFEVEAMGEDLSRGKEEGLSALLIEESKAESLKKRGVHLQLAVDRERVFSRAQVALEERVQENESMIEGPEKEIALEACQKETGRVSELKRYAEHAYEAVMAEKVAQEAQEALEKWTEEVRSDVDALVDSVHIEVDEDEDESRGSKRMDGELSLEERLGEAERMDGELSLEERLGEAERSLKK